MGAVQPKPGDVLVLAGTMKGLWVFRSDVKRKRWDVSGPHFKGQSVYSAAYDSRKGRQRLWVGNSSEHWGPGLSSSDDFGATWTTHADAIRFPKNTDASLDKIWQIRPAGDEDPNTIYCGVQPAALFRSKNAGRSWTFMRALWDHPHRERWMPGFGGLCMHTVLPDPRSPDHITVAVSAAGVYQTKDGGKSWKSMNKGIRAEFLPDKYPEFGQCVHKIVSHPARPSRMFLQNHWGLYRSDNAGRSWTDIANGVPSDFGFAMTMHPHDPDTVYIVPIESDGFRCTPEGKLRVYRTKNAGKSWEPLTRGLPQKNALETILRDGMDTDGADPAGLYFGTRSGALYGSRKDGNSWEVMRDGLPPVVCVKAAVVPHVTETRVAVVVKSGAKKKTKKKTKKKIAKKTARKKPVRRKVAARAPARKKKTAKKRPRRR